MTWLRLTLFFSMILVETQAQEGEIVTPGERGKYHGSNRIGIWEYRDRPGGVSLKVDYTNQRLVYIKPDTSGFIIKKNNLWVKEKLEIPCRFHGSQALLESHYRAFSFPFDVVTKKKTARVFLTFEVNEN